jgi:5S rRNA maturation endonuclease (ribonuclease M5)
MKSELEALEGLLQELREDPRPKLVEGEKDKKALERLGIRNIVLIQPVSLAKVAGEVGSDVILLTDYDRRGELMAQRLAELLHNEGVRVDVSYRRELRQLTGIRQVEEITKKYEDMREGSKTRRDTSGKLRFPA